MDFLKESLNSHSGHNKPTNTTTTTQPEHHNAAGDHQTKPHRQPSTSELMSSAKVVAEAAKATMGGNKSSEVDKAKVAEAAADLLDAAHSYGKIDESSGLGKYLGQAESYLHKYGSSHPGGVGAGAAGGHGHGGVVAGEEGKKKEEEKHGGGGGGGASDYFKMAEGFLKK